MTAFALFCVATVVFNAARDLLAPDRRAFGLERRSDGGVAGRRMLTLPRSTLESVVRAVAGDETCAVAEVSDGLAVHFECFPPKPVGGTVR